MNIRKQLDILKARKTRGGQSENPFGPVASQRRLDYNKNITQELLNNIKQSIEHMERFLEKEADLGMVMTEWNSDLATIDVEINKLLKDLIEINSTGE